MYDEQVSDEQIFDQLDEFERITCMQPCQIARDVHSEQHPVARQNTDVLRKLSQDFIHTHQEKAIHGSSSQCVARPVLPGLSGEHDCAVQQPSRLGTSRQPVFKPAQPNHRDAVQAVGRNLSSLPYSMVYQRSHHLPSSQVDPGRYLYDGVPTSSTQERRLRISRSPFNNSDQRASRPMEGEHHDLLSSQPDDYYGFPSPHVTEVARQSSEMLAPGYSPQMSTICRNVGDIFSRQHASKLHGKQTPIVQGIQQIDTRELPDRLRAIFPYKLFNAVQSRCYDAIFSSDDNFVLSAPTGSGKTVVLELAICRLLSTHEIGSFKIVYLAPTKALCSERRQDWQNKFGPLDIQCAELTGDTDIAQRRDVQLATIIVTTPEKWDSISRKWKDHLRLMQMVRLFLIDEVHILKEDRGATLEAIVSRMKSICSDVRYVALSATIPNFKDVATWLGRNSTAVHTPAVCERFGEEFRPVPLQRHVLGYQNNANDFVFERFLNKKLPEVINKYSRMRPIMIFCFTRKSCVETSKLLASWWNTSSPTHRHWKGPTRTLTVMNADLKATVSSGVAVHHAGLDPNDRITVEKAYLEGEINVICCTSTLAVGVNLPCYMVIVKNTVSYHTNIASTREYSELEILQMLGRAGRPQFGTQGIAVIMTRAQKKARYEKMIAGEEIVESCLHRNLIDHLNAEISLGTVTSAASAKSWLSGTFLHVRLKANPDYYEIQGDASGGNLDQRLESICAKDLELLHANDLVSTGARLESTKFGDSMARCHIQFETMTALLALEPKANVSEILSTVSQAAEFKEVRFRSGEKTAYKKLNDTTWIKYPIRVNLDSFAHKVSLVVQATLGGVELSTSDSQVESDFRAAKAVVFQHVHRLVRCIIDCQVQKGDSITTRNALMLARSLSAQAWDDSPMCMKQLEGIGPVAVRKLNAAGIRSIEDLEGTETHVIERVMSRNPPYGSQLLQTARSFPRLRVGIKLIGDPKMKDEHLTVKVKVEFGFLNENPPEKFNGRVLNVCLLIERSDGEVIDFARISGSKLGEGQEYYTNADLTSGDQSIRAHTMCEDVAGTAQHAMLKPGIPAGRFPAAKSIGANEQHLAIKRLSSAKTVRREGNDFREDQPTDDYDDADIDDADLVAAENIEYMDIDQFDEGASTTPPQKRPKFSTGPSQNEGWQPERLSNGNWACNHACKDKASCRHFCCREGVDRKPKPPKAKESKKVHETTSTPRQTQISVSSAAGAAAKAKLADFYEGGSTDRRRPRKTKLFTTPYVATTASKLPNFVQQTNIDSACGRDHQLSTSARANRIRSPDSSPDPLQSDFSVFEPRKMSHNNSPGNFHSGPASTIVPCSSPVEDSEARFEAEAPSKLRKQNPQHLENISGNEIATRVDYVDLSSFTDDVDTDGGGSDTVCAGIKKHASAELPTTHDILSQAEQRERHRKEGGIFVAGSTDSTHADVDSSNLPDRSEKKLESGSTSTHSFSRDKQQDLTSETQQQKLADKDESMNTEELQEWFEREFGTELFNFVK